MQRILEQVQKWHPEVRVVAYLDDTFLQGPEDKVVEAFRDVKMWGLQVGLEAQDGKCAAYAHGCKEAAARVAAELRFAGVNEDGIVAAGCPIGTDTFVAQQANACADKVVSEIELLMSLDVSAQIKLALLRKSLQMKVSHLARCAPFPLIQPALQKSEEAVLKSVMQIMGRQEEQVDVEQMRLPLRLGGLGLQHLTASDGLTCRAAFLSAAALTQTAMREGDESLQPFTGRFAAAARQELEQHWEHMQGACLCSGECRCNENAGTTLDEALQSGGLPDLQRAVSQQLATLQANCLLDKYKQQLDDPDRRDGAKEHLARLFSVQHPVATAWLSVLPTKQPWTLTDETVRTALQFMLGASPGPKPQEYFVCLCNQQTSNCHHAMTCPKFAGYRTSRHNFIQQMVRYVFSSAGLASSIEPQEKHLKGLQPGDTGYGQRGDILVPLMDDILNIDVSVTHPASQEYRDAACRRPGAAAERRDTKKMNDHAKDGTSGYSFIPFSIESYGRLGKPAEQLLKEVAEKASSTGMCDRNDFLQWSYREISVRLIKGNARIFQVFCQVLSRGVGKDFVLGQEEPGHD